MATKKPSSVSEPPDLSALSGSAFELAEAFVALLASDIVLVIGKDGTVTNVVQGRETQIAPSRTTWLGSPWVDTVTGDTQQKVVALLDEVRRIGRSRRREINHRCEDNSQVPVAYTAIELGSGGPVLAVGRDLRSVNAIQQRFTDAQREIEMTYWRTKQAESRYRLLFEVATDAVLLVDDRLRITECNEATAELFDRPIEEVVGRPAAFAFDRFSQVAIDDLVTSAFASMNPSEVVVRLMHRTGKVSVAVTPLRIDDELFATLRIRALDPTAQGAELNSTISRLVNDASDSVVVTDAAGHIIVANRAFLKLLKVTTDDGVQGHPLDHWVSVADGTWTSFQREVRRKGVVRHQRASVVLRTAEVAHVRLTATLLNDGDQERIGITIHRDSLLRGPGRFSREQSFRNEIDEVVSHLGRRPMPTLLRQIRTMAERYLIERALDLSDGDRDRAARLLGADASRLDVTNGRSPESDE